MFKSIQKVLHNKIFWYLFSRYFTFALQLLSSIYIAVQLGLYYWGIWSFILLLTNIGIQLNWGIGSATTILMIQHKNDKQCQKFIYNAFILVLLGMLPIALLMLYETIAPIPFLKKYHLTHSIYGVFVIIFLGHMNNLLMNISRTKNNIFAVAFNQSIFPILCFILMFFARSTTLFYLLLTAYIFSMLVSFILYMKQKHICFSEKFDFSFCTTIISKGFFLFLYNACFALIILSTKLLVSYYYPVESFGIFSFAFNIASAALLLVDSITFIAQAKMIDLLQGNEPTTILKRVKVMRQSYLICITSIIYLAIPAFYFLIKFIPKYKDSFDCFTMIILSLGLYPICYGYNTYLLAHNKEKFMAILAISSLFANFLVTWILAYCFQVSIEYCLIGIMTTYLLYALLIILFAEKLIFSKWMIKNIINYIPPYIAVPFFVTLYLQNTNNKHINWLPLVIFLILGIKEISKFLNNLISFINSPNIMDINNETAE